MWIYYQALCYVLLIYVFAFVQVPHCLYCYSFVYSNIVLSELWECDTPSWFFFLKMAFTVWSLLLFHINFTMIIFSSLINIMGGNCLKLVDCFGKWPLILILLIHKYVGYCSISLYILQFSSTMFYIFRV